MYLMQTVSAVPRPRAAVHMETRSPCATSASIDIQNCIKHLTENDNGYGSYRNSKESTRVQENGIRQDLREQHSNDYNKLRIANCNPTEADVNQLDGEDGEKEKKKDKKWSLGGLFRRKSRKDADDSSDESGDGRKGFLSRKKCKRDRRKPRAKTTANGFDVIIPPQKDGMPAVNGIGKAVEDLWGNGNVNGIGNAAGPVRYIHRHHYSGVSNTDSTKTKDTLQVPKTSRKESSLSRNSSGGSGSLEGRKGRKEVLARAEAKRERMRDESSSDENESYHSSSSLSRSNADKDGRRPRGRHLKRLSRDEESFAVQKENDLRIVKSDLESHRLPPNNRWVPKGYFPDSSDHENTKFSLVNHSTSPSPARSPRVRQRHMMLSPPASFPTSYPVSTFPPGIHYPQGRVVPTFDGLYPNPTFVHAKDSQIHISQPLLSGRKSNRNSEFVQPSKRSASEHSTNRRTLMDYERFLSSCGPGKEKSSSFDQDIHRACYFENDTSDAMTSHLPFGQATAFGVQAEPHGDGRKQYPSPRGGRRILGPNPYMDVSQRMLNPCENANGLAVVTPTRSLPAHGYHAMQRSASGNSCTLYENSTESAYNQIRSNSHQHIPSYVNQQQAFHSPANSDGMKSCLQFPVNGLRYPNYRTMTERTAVSPPFVINDAKDKVYPKPGKDSMQSALVGESGQPSLPKLHLNGSVPSLRYYADQNPRSRNPIHITCNPSPSSAREQPAELPVAKGQTSVKEAITSASDFWKLKDQEIMMEMKKASNSNSPAKPPATQSTQSSSRCDRSGSGSPRSRDPVKVKNESNRKVAKVEEKEVVPCRVPSASPISQKPEVQSKAKPSAGNSNLDDALNELESIYNSLRLGDEDLISRAERRDLPTYKASCADYSKRISKTEANATPNTVLQERTPYDALYPGAQERQKTVPQRRSGVPDKVSDDMAYRRMNAKDRTESKKFPPHSYLRSSPALSPVLGDSPNSVLPKETSHEPDVTYDDVVFRNIRHANSTLKIQDPQPPFGIPLGPITPAPNSDYLHATPKERFRPTFMSSKVPDVVKDDLAFRNLRKDPMTANLPTVENPVVSRSESSPGNALTQKKRAVRSLSANLYNLIQRENAGASPVETNNNIMEKDCEKTQSLVDLSEKEGKNALEKRLKELKEEKNAKRAEFFELAMEQRRKRNSKSNLSWTELAHLNDDYDSVPQINTSTETLTEDKEYSKNHIHQRLRLSENAEDSSRQGQTAETTKTYRCPIVELSKYPAAAPSSTLYGNPFREHDPESPLDESQLEDLLSALEKEAKNTSEDLSRQLVELEISAGSNPKEDKKSTEETKRRSRSLTSEKVEGSSRFSSLERRKRRRSRNSSRSAAEDEEEPTELLDKLCSSIQSEMPTEETNQADAKPDEDVGRLANEIIQITEELLRREATAAEHKRNSVSGFEVVTDLSQILHEMEEHEASKPKDTFQEVYEYNCGDALSGERPEGGPEASQGEGGEEESTGEKDIEREFERLHMEANGSAAADEEEVVNGLIADVTRGCGAGSEPLSPLPFPKDQAPNVVVRRCGDGSPPGTYSGEGKDRIANDLYETNDLRQIQKEERLTNMLDSEAEDKKGGQRMRTLPVTNLSSENGCSRKRIESYKENRRKELLTKYGSRVESSTSKSPRESRRREEVRGGCGCSPLASSSENQVPSSDVRRYISRREQNKTETQPANNVEAVCSRVEAESQQPVIVRDTKTSRLRAATRSSLTDGKKLWDKEKNVTSSSALSTSNSLNRKEVDKSHKRKSFLNRSHTSEVYSAHLPDESAINLRRSLRNSLADSKKDEVPTSTSKLLTSKVLNCNGSVSRDVSQGADKSQKPLSCNTSVLSWTRRNQNSDENNSSRSVTNGERKPWLAKQKSSDGRKSDSQESNSNETPACRLEDIIQRKSHNENVNGSVASAENSRAKKNSAERNSYSPDNFARRAQMLAATTLKMINRLDEINRKSRVMPTLGDGNSGRARSCSYGNGAVTQSPSKQEVSHGMDGKKGSLSEDNTAKNNSSSVLNCRSNRQIMRSTDNKPSVDRESFKAVVRRESTKADSSTRSPKLDSSSRPSSILKKKVTSDAVPTSTDNRKPKPVSILKRKSLSQDEGYSKSNLSFSPSVLESKETTKRQGILKKRRSLDENEVLRRRNFLPDTASLEFKPILKNQRRSSMEELPGRCKSPDYLPQSILKRKSSRDEDPEEGSGSCPMEPQGILKRPAQQHVKISEAAVRGSGIVMGELQAGEYVRPILKKKSSSEDHSTPELSVAEAPKPILKKKSSLETDETEDKPKKPILKTSCRRTSADDSDDVNNSRSSSLSGIEPEYVKPILKRENSRSRLTEAGKFGDEVVVLRRIKPNRPGRPLSYSELDNELHAAFIKRRSLEFSPSAFYKLDWDLRRARSVSLNEKSLEDLQRRPSSVAERVHTLENFLQLERERSRGRESPSSPQPSPTSTTPPGPRGGSPPGTRTKFRTGDVFTRSDEASASINVHKACYTDSIPSPSTSSPRPDEEVKQRSKPGETLRDSDDEVCRCRRNSSAQGTSPSVRLSQLGSISGPADLPEDAANDSDPTTESELSSRGLSNDRDDSEYLSAVESCSTKLSALDVRDTEPLAEGSGNMEEAREVAEEIFLLQKSGSVTAKASIFQELEKKFKTSSSASAEENKARTSAKGGNEGIRRYKERKSQDSTVQKYHTQPVSTQDVEAAIRQSRNCPDHKPQDVENFEDELSSMSLLDRVRLFNDRIRRESNKSPPLPGPVPVRKRGPRFRTQPVTTEEVETAQGQQRLSPLAASLMRPPDPDLFGLGILSARSLKEKMYDHATAVLKSMPSPEKSEENGKRRRKGILKNLSRGEMEREDQPKNLSSGSDSSDNEIKSILRNEPNTGVTVRAETERRNDKDSNLVLKGILKQLSTDKKATSSSEESYLSEEEEGNNGKSRKNFAGSNLATILQSVEPVKAHDPKDEEASDEGSSSGGREIHKFVRNEAVTRRRQATLNKIRSNSSLVKSQSHSAVSSICWPPRKGQNEQNPSDRFQGRSSHGETERPQCKDSIKSGGDGSEDGGRHDGLRRSTTQPLEGLEGHADDDMSGASIQERLARLKKSGENGWQKRKPNVSSSMEFTVASSGNYLFGEAFSTRSQPQNQKDVEDLRSSASILADRLDKLDAAKEGWRKRVPPSDAAQFSVEGKMLGRVEGVCKSPLLQVSTTKTHQTERKKRCPKAVPFRSKNKQPSLNSMPSSPSEVVSNPISRSVSAPGGGRNGLFSLPGCEENGPVVPVPKTDDETFTKFFNGLCSDALLEERLDIKDEDLDVVSRMQSSQLLVQKRTVKIQRRRATLKNPLKTLAARKDLQEEYTETKTGIAEKELKRLKIEKASKNSTLAIEALAGLASQEDFTAINLKKASDGGVSSPAPPFKNLMLLLVKGRRHVQTRMVEPVARSINAGDCFILVTPKKVFNYVGEYANVIEKSRAAEISLQIQQNSDLGCSTHSVVTIGGGGKATQEQVKEFWRLLGDEGGQERSAGHPDEDEVFESAIIDTNMIYEVVGDELIPVDQFWGSIPRIELLNSNKVLVFDFGSEFYVWIGKNVSLLDRKVALQLARELWEEGYNYTDCDVCPLGLDFYFDRIDEPDGIPESKKAGPVRPDWALFAKITENMETVLFREKFLDWPDYSRVIRRGKKGDCGEQSDGNGYIEAKPCDARAMLDHVRSEPDLVLEGAHLGRGIRHFEEETRRCAEVTTRGVTVWHISEYEYSELPAASFGQFHMEDSYVVRWHYLITVTGRELSGQPSKHLSVGRDRFAYFCWQGRDSPVNDKGAAACLTVELDKEHGPQVRVIQGFEPPAFLNLFRGSMVVHSGRRDSDVPREKWRLFICRGEEYTETALFEVPTSMRQLRSAASFVLVGSERRLIIVWHGVKSPNHIRKMALQAGKQIQTETPPEFSFESGDVRIREELEGAESSDFVRALGGNKRQLYYSFLDNKVEEVKTPRLFHLSSVSGEFLFSEVSSPSFNKDVVTPFPFLQDDLYSAPQPALFMMDTGSCLWLWQGWWEAESGEGDRGSGILRFQAERRAAMTTAISYWNLRYGTSVPKAYLVWAGLEPLVFTNLFPIWTDRDHVSEINMKEGRKPGEIVSVKTELATLTQSTYPLEQLLTRPLPDGVNPSFLEDYLEPQCFQELFGMTMEEFYNLQSWKKKKLKQDAGLF